MCNLSKLLFLTWKAAHQRHAWILLLYFASYYLEKLTVVASHGLPLAGGLLLPPLHPPEEEEREDLQHDEQISC